MAAPRQHHHADPSSEPVRAESWQTVDIYAVIQELKKAVLEYKPRPNEEVDRNIKLLTERYSGGNFLNIDGVGEESMMRRILRDSAKKQFDEKDSGRRFKSFRETIILKLLDENTLIEILWQEAKISKNRAILPTDKTHVDWYSNRKGKPTTLGRILSRVFNDPGLQQLQFMPDYYDLRSTALNLDQKPLADASRAQLQSSNTAFRKQLGDFTIAKTIANRILKIAEEHGIDLNNHLLPVVPPTPLIDLFDKISKKLEVKEDESKKASLVEDELFEDFDRLLFLAKSSESFKRILTLSSKSSSDEERENLLVSFAKEFVSDSNFMIDISVSRFYDPDHFLSGMQMKKELTIGPFKYSYSDIMREFISQADKNPRFDIPRDQLRMRLNVIENFLISKDLLPPHPRPVVAPAASVATAASAPRVVLESKTPSLVAGAPKIQPAAKPADATLTRATAVSALTDLSILRSTKPLSAEQSSRTLVNRKFMRLLAIKQKLESITDQKSWFQTKANAFSLAMPDPSYAGAAEFIKFAKSLKFIHPVGDIKDASKELEPNIPADEIEDYFNRLMALKGVVGFYSAGEKMNPQLRDLARVMLDNTRDFNAPSHKLR